MTLMGAATPTQTTCRAQQCPSNMQEPIVSARVHADDGTAAKQTSAESKTAIPTAVKVKQRKFANGDKYVGGWLNGLVSLLKRHIPCST